MKFAYFVTFFCVVPFTFSADPGIIGRVTKKALDYIGLLGEQLLSYEIGKLEIPDFSSAVGGPGQGKVSAKNIKTVNFQGPSFWYRLDPEHQIMWGTRGGQILLTGDWSMRYRALITIKGQGTFTVEARDIELLIRSTLSRTEAGGPRVSADGCNARIDQLEIRVTGGIVGWLINKFSGKIQNHIAGMVRAQACEKLTHLINNNANAKLDELPVYMPLNEHFIIDYRLLANPEVHPSYIESHQKGQITAIKDMSDVPFSPKPMDVSHVKQQRMLYLYASEFVVNSLFWSAHTQQMTRFLISNQTTPHLAPYLKTTCESMCIGDAIKAIRMKYPDKMATVFLAANRPPTCSIVPDKAFFRANLTGDMFIPLENGSKAHLLSFLVEFEGQLRLRVERMRLVGELYIKDLDVDIVKSSVGKIPEFEVELFLIFAEPFLESFVNKHLKKGLPIRTIEHAEFVNPEVNLLNRTIEIETDIHYVPFKAKNYENTLL